MPSGSTTIAPKPVVGKCALSRGPIKRTERPGHPRTLPLGFLLLVDHRLPSLCHSATFAPYVSLCAGLCVKSLHHSVSGFSCENLCGIVRGLKGKNKGKIKARECCSPGLDNRLIHPCVPALIRLCRRACMVRLRLWAETSRMELATRMP